MKMSFCSKLFRIFGAIAIANSQTDKCWQKHNLVGEGRKEIEMKNLSLSLLQTTSTQSIFISEIDRIKKRQT